MAFLHALRRSVPGLAVIAGSAGAAVLLANSDGAVRDPMGFVIWPVGCQHAVCFVPAKLRRFKVPLRDLMRPLIHTACMCDRQGQHMQMPQPLHRRQLWNQTSSLVLSW